MSELIAHAKLTTNKQITLPKKIQNELKIKDGEYLMFFKENNRIYIERGGIKKL